MFIAIGIVAALAFLLMRQESHAPLLLLSRAASSSRSTTERSSSDPGFLPGLANGVILGYLMYRSELVPRGMTWLGLIGGPLVMITGVLVIIQRDPARGAHPIWEACVEGLWELSLSILLHREGVQSIFAPLHHGERDEAADSDSALRHET
jgi:hypothetical protein